MIGLFTDEVSLDTSDSLSEKSFDEKQQEAIAKIKPVKDSLDFVFKEYNLSVCQIYNDVSEIEKKSIKDADNKYPNFGKKHLEYSEKLRIERTKKYWISKGISEELLDKAILYSDECSEKERLENIKKLKEQKQVQALKKDKIEDCFSNACRLTRRQIKSVMHNPKSFEYVDCKYLGAGESTFTIRYSYRGQNKLGATVLESVKAEIDIEKCKVIKIE